MTLHFPDHLPFFGNRASRTPRCSRKPNRKRSELKKQPKLRGDQKIGFFKITILGVLVIMDCFHEAASAAETQDGSGAQSQQKRLQDANKERIRKRAKEFQSDSTCNATWGTCWNWAVQEIGYLPEVNTCIDNTNQIIPSMTATQRIFGFGGAMETRLKRAGRRAAREVARNNADELTKEELRFSKSEKNQDQITERAQDRRFHKDFNTPAMKRRQDAVRQLYKESLGEPDHNPEKSFILKTLKHRTSGEVEVALLEETTAIMNANGLRSYDWDLAYDYVVNEVAAYLRSGEYDQHPGKLFE